jgi:hypothetical protein
MRLETVQNNGGGELREQIKQLRWELAAMVLMTFLRLGNSDQGARSLADPLIDLFRTSIDAYNKTAAAVYNRHLVPRLMRANPELGERVTDYPQFTPTSVAEIPLQVLSFLGQISTFLSTAQAPDANWLRNALGMEEIELDETIAKPLPNQTASPDGQAQNGKGDQGQGDQEEERQPPDEDEEEEEGALSLQRRWLTTITPAEVAYMQRAATELQMARAAHLRPLTTRRRA